MYLIYIENIYYKETITIRYNRLVITPQGCIISFVRTYFVCASFLLLHFTQPGTTFKEKVKKWIILTTLLHYSINIRKGFD